ncbi:MAG: M48 family metallopeptidase [Kiritimatiellaeota bacterium]|nr:M48 family metallopeptidase [Kiritimatiellota bacterium]
MLDFFQQQDNARRSTKWLVLLYIVAVLGVALGIHAVFGGLIMWGADEESPLTFAEAFLNPNLAACTFGLTLLLIGICSVYKILALRQGGPVVAKLMGGTEVAANTTNFAEKRLLNVVEEMALASGVTMPRVYVMREEKGLNAFAAGWSPDNAAVAVTAGLLATLNREELQTVIAHEFSHVLNGDMRLNIRLIGVLHGIFALTILGYWVMRIAPRLASSSSSSSKKKDSGAGGAAMAVFLIGLAVWIIGQIGFWIGRLIQASVSRKREKLADASAVQFTRNPFALADALKLIGSQGGKLKSANTSEVSHMLFACGANSLLATHPPILERVRACDPTFDGDFAAAREKLLKNRFAKDKPEAKPKDDETDIPAILGGGMGAALPGLGGGTEIPRSALHTAGMLAWLGDDNRASLQQDTSQAEACLCAALLSADPSVRIKQLASCLPAHLLESRVLEWEKRHQPWSLAQSRQACEIAVNALRRQPPEKLAPLLAAIDALVAADGQTSPFEFAISRMVHRRLQPPDDVNPGLLSPQKLAPEISRVLSVIAGFEAKTPDVLTQLFNAGAMRLSELTGPLSPLSGDALRDIPALDDALLQLRRLAPIHKREFMLACRAVAEADHVVTDVQDNLLFAIADAIEATGWNAKN